MPRHIVEKSFSLVVKVGNKEVDMNNSGWTEQTPEGLAKFLRKNAPKWQELVVTKHVVVIDTKKQKGDNVVSKKQATLEIGRIDGFSFGTHVDNKMQKDGRVPSNIVDFFGIQKQKE